LLSVHEGGGAEAQTPLEHSMAQKELQHSENFIESANINSIK